MLNQQRSHTQQQLKKPRDIPWVLLAVFAFFLWLIWGTLFPQLPDKETPLILYSNQTRQDIRSTLLEAIYQAKKSIHLVVFGLSDKAVLNNLAKKIEQNIPTTVYYDPKASAKAYKILKGADVYPVQTSALMHQKILSIDHETVFIGSANMTTTSLKMHDNLVVGLHSPIIAKFVEEHEPFSQGHLKTFVGDQKIEIWLLPDPRGHVLSELRRQIRLAQKSIQIALFTFTHPSLIDEVIDAKKRGVKVDIVIDKTSAKGASQKAIAQLTEANVPVCISTGEQLLHHKFILIDKNTLLTGSLNWTKAAFYKNCDLIMAIYDLNIDQKKFMQNLWSKIEDGAIAAP